MLRYLENDGFSEQELQAAGVIGVTEEEGRPYDFLRERVLFPIRDAQGRTIAFGGRSLDDAVQPKYLNTRETLLFHKNETLFALDLARKPMAQERQAVVVEGYMDAVMAHQHGYRNVVATLGTAVTDRHLRLLRRQVDEIVLALDADAAGQAATWRALQVADESLRTGVTPVVGPNRRQQRFVADRAVRLRVLALPNAKDPDELIRSDPDAWPALVGAALPVVDFVLERMEARHDLTTRHGQSRRRGRDRGSAGRHRQSDRAGRLHQRGRGSAQGRSGGRAALAEDLAERTATHATIEPAIARGCAAAADRRARRHRRRLSARAADAAARRARRTGRSTAPSSSCCPRAASCTVISAHLRSRATFSHTPTEPADRLADVERLPTDKLLEGIELKRLEIRGKKLQAELADVSTLLREGAIDRSEAERLLNDYGRQMGEVARLLPPERESAGTR